MSAQSSGSTLARARVDVGLEQHELAEQLGIKQSQISRYETGKVRPRYELAKRIAVAVGRTVDDLWPTLERAVRKGRLLGTVIAEEQAVKPRQLVDHFGLRLVHETDTGGIPVYHEHRPPICCGCAFCRVVDLNDPETYRTIGEPVLIAAGGVNG